MSYLKFSSSSPQSLLLQVINDFVTCEFRGLAESRLSIEFFFKKKSSRDLPHIIETVVHFIKWFESVLESE